MPLALELLRDSEVDERLDDGGGLADEAPVVGDDEVVGAGGAPVLDRAREEDELLRLAGVARIDEGPAPVGAGVQGSYQPGEQEAWSRRRRRGGHFGLERREVGLEGGDHALRGQLSADGDPDPSPDG